MMRFDEMEEFKGSLSKILDVSKKKPLLASVITKNVMNTMDFFLSCQIPIAIMLLMF